MLGSPVFDGEYFVPTPSNVRVRCSESWGNDAPPRAAEWATELPADQVVSIAEGPEGNIWVLTSSDAGTQRGLAIVDQRGAIVSFRVYEQFTGFGPIQLLYLADAGLVAVGYQQVDEDAFARIWRLDENGTIVSEHDLGQPVESLPHVAAVADDELVIAGTTAEDLGSLEQPHFHWVARFGAEGGSPVWSAPLVSDSRDLVTNDELVVVSSLYGISAYDITNGTKLWEHSAGTYLRDIAIDPSGGVMFAGYTNGLIDVGHLDEGGSITWREYHYNAAFDGMPAYVDTRGMIDDGQGNVVLTASEEFPTPPLIAGGRECMNRWIVGASVSGAVRWADRVEGCHTPWSHGDAIVDGRVIIGGALAEVDAETGGLRERAWVRSYRM
ncbi:MAG: PQQ-binding-like beta-propeller repeat protein [Deltaproteobacteria bacterium]|nr:PQQ-binding-like beta-propeller repeat protein [Deltaproteobacteria bacterium]